MEISTFNVLLTVGLTAGVGLVSTIGIILISYVKQTLSNTSFIKEKLVKHETEIDDLKEFKRETKDWQGIADNRIYNLQKASLK